MTLLHIDPTLRPALKEVDKQSDRGAAIIACAIVDELLTRALQKPLILTSEVKDKLFSNERNGPLATFSNKIDLGFATGLLNSKVRSDLRNIRRVRNRFAHRLDPLEFKEAEISNWWIC